MNRIEAIQKQAGTDARSNMALLLNNLDMGELVPQADKYYVFVYTPKTKNIQYDQHPFVQVSSVHRWGFVGLNHHWDDFRRYTWAECGTPLYEIYPDEIQDMYNFPIAFFKNS